MVVCCACDEAGRAARVPRVPECARARSERPSRASRRTEPPPLRRQRRAQTPRKPRARRITAPHNLSTIDSSFSHFLSPKVKLSRRIGSLAIHAPVTTLVFGLGGRTRRRPTARSGPHAPACSGAAASKPPDR